MDVPKGPPSAGTATSRWWNEPKWRAYLAIAGAFVTIVMSTSMVFVLLSAIADDFGITLRAVGWVVIIESLVISALLLPLGGLADTIGRRRLYLWGLAILGVGAVLTGLAPTFSILIAARMFMSFGNAMVQAVGTGMLAAAFPPEEKGLAMGAQTTAVSAGAAFGPLVGGLGLQVVDWRTLFLLLAVPVALSIVAGLLILEDDSATAGPIGSGFDYTGSLLAGAAVVAVVTTISNPFALSWVSAGIGGGAVAAALILCGFVVWELRHPKPVFELRLFGLPTFRTAVLVRFVGFIGNTAVTLLLPIYLISLRGFADGLTGAVLFCIAAGMAVGAQISGRLSDRVGPRRPSLAGLALQMVVLISLATFGQDTPFALVVGLAILAGLAASLWNVPNNGAMMGSVPSENFAVVGAFTNVTRTMGNVVGQALATAIVVAVMTARGFDIPLSEIVDTSGADDAFLQGWRRAFLVATATTGVTLAVAWLLPAKPVVAPESGVSAGPNRP